MHAIYDFGDKKEMKLGKNQKTKPQFSSPPLFAWDPTRGVSAKNNT